MRKLHLNSGSSSGSSSSSSSGGWILTCLIPPKKYNSKCKMVERGRRQENKNKKFLVKVEILQ